MSWDITGKRIWVAGHRGMVGGAVVRRHAEEDCEVVTAGRETVDLTRQADVESWMAKTRSDAIVMAAAKVGGILANDTYSVDFLVENLQIETNIAAAAHACDVDRFLFLGSSCIYPKLAEQPMREDALLTGPLEPTNGWYAIAKIAGIKLCQAYRKQHGATGSRQCRPISMVQATITTFNRAMCYRRSCASSMKLRRRAPNR